MSLLADRLADLPQPHAPSREAVAERASQVLRPSDALAWLDELAVWKAGWQASTSPSVARPHVLVFAADHGVAAAGVSNYPSDVTAADAHCDPERPGHRQCLRLHGRRRGHRRRRGRRTPDWRHANRVGARPERFDEATQAAFAAVDELDADLLVLGELGIGNTTAAAAVAAAFAGGEATVWVAVGAASTTTAWRASRQLFRNRCDGSLASWTLSRSCAKSAVPNWSRWRPPVWQLDIVRSPVVLDGYICTASMLPLHVASPDALDHCIVGHCSAEPGHRLLLDRLGKKPLLDLDMRLGEGSGATAAIPLVAMACAGVTTVPTFDEFFGSQG